MANLAIKGHASRGKEIIGFLRMLGANNTYQLSGDEDYAYYVIERGEIRVGDIIFGNEPYVIFTLEEFLEKFPYKVGAKVSAFGNKWTVIDAVWDGSIEEVVYTISSNTSKYITTKLSNQLQPYEEENFGECIYKTIQECLFGKEETMDRKYNVEEYLTVGNKTEKGLEILVNDKFGLKEDNGKFFVINKQVEYPKTYEGCCGVLYIEPHRIIEHDDCCGYRDITQYDVNLLTQLRRFHNLLICRDAYWKIAGEEMRLSEPWEPNWNNDQYKYIIRCRRDKIIKDTITANNSILAFPTEKIRDAFYENFKDLIEKCKTFL